MTTTLNKLLIPVRSRNGRADALTELVATAKGNTLVPSIAHGMAVSSAAEGAIKDVVSQFWNTDTMSAEQAMERLAAAARTK